MKGRKKGKPQEGKRWTPRRVLRRVLHGNLVTSTWFARHWVKIVVLVGLIMVFIASKYQTMTLMEEIKSLEKDLEVSKTERIRERADYMSRIRESSMQQLVDSVLPGMGIQEQPPYALTIDESTDK